MPYKSIELTPCLIARQDGTVGRTGHGKQMLIHSIIQIEDDGFIIYIIWRGFVKSDRRKKRQLSCNE